MANIITCCRILFSVILLFFSTFSVEFYVIYTLAGLTDVLDGFIARKTRTESNIGSKIDTIADVCFLLSCFIKILPILAIPLWLWIWIAVIAIIKIGNVILGFVIRKCFVAEHTIINKALGVCMFLFPFFISIFNINVCIVLLATMATFAAIHETYCISGGGTAEK